MGKGGKKKLAIPLQRDAPGKRTGNPGALLPDASTSRERVSWRFAHVDHDSRWNFATVEPRLLSEILRKLADCESMTVTELRNTRRFFKEYELPGGLCKEAQARLTAMGRDDMTTIQRLEFTGTQRLYGFLEGNIFHVVWWDPHHEVYPSRLRNT